PQPQHRGQVMGWPGPIRHLHHREPGQPAQALPSATALVRAAPAGEIAPPGLGGPEHPYRHPARRAPLREHGHVRAGPTGRGAEHVGDPRRGTARIRAHRLHLPALLAARARRSPPSSTSAATPNTAAAPRHASTVTIAFGMNPETGRLADTNAPTAPPATAPARPAPAAR